jgi:hypothetical protein
MVPSGIAIDGDLNPPCWMLTALAALPLQVFIKSDLEQLERRLTQVESDKERVMVEAKELENHMLSRLGFHSDDIEAMRKTVNDLVGDLSRIQTQQVGGWAVAGSGDPTPEPLELCQVI